MFSLWARRELLGVEVKTAVYSREMKNRPGFLPPIAYYATPKRRTCRVDLQHSGPVGLQVWGGRWAAPAQVFGLEFQKVPDAAQRWRPGVPVQRRRGGRRKCRRPESPERPGVRAGPPVSSQLRVPGPFWQVLGAEREPLHLLLPERWVARAAHAVVDGTGRRGPAHPRPVLVGREHAGRADQPVFAPYLELRGAQVAVAVLVVV